jgi:hypothetical protein
MKPSNRIALMFSLSTVLLCGAALAQNTAAPPPAPAAIPAPAATTLNDMVSPKPAHHHKAKAKAAVHGVKYDTCVKEKTAVAENFCSSHGSSCQSEKDGIAKQCRSEARGERQKG